MVTKITLYIGADNKTGKINKEYKDRIVTTIGKYYDDFTLRKSLGCWKGTIEDSIEAVLLIFNLIFKDLDNCINELKVNLVQERIGLEIEANVDFKLK